MPFLMSSLIDHEWVRQVSAWCLVGGSDRVATCITNRAHGMGMGIHKGTLLLQSLSNVKTPSS